ncbi:MAG: protein-methionine-sulfoxide reductase heme-binding subunit MsrQ [Steroidobacteraceae bacterium]
MPPSAKVRIGKTLLVVAVSLPLLVIAAGLFDAPWASLGVDPVREIEHRLGKTALNLLGLTLLVSPLQQLLGKPWLVQLRRTLGLSAFGYALLHLLAYASLDLEFNWAQLGTDIAKRPYITVGVLALAMMLPLAITSTDRLMRRLGRKWLALHRLIYPAATLAVLHYYWQVKRDVREPLVYAAVLAALLGYRWWRQRARLHRRPHLP